MPTAHLTEKKRWTYQEYVELDDDKRYEIIEGELLMSPAPNFQHQIISRDLGTILWGYVQQKDLGEVVFAPLDVILDEENVVEPDIVFIAKENLAIVHAKGIIGSPDVLIEILSPSSLYRDKYQKKELYERFKVKEYWIVDPANSTIEVFVLQETGYTLFSFAAEKGKIQSKVIEGFEVEIAEIMK
jgi:Uma2 family endonuclease